MQRLTSSVRARRVLVAVLAALAVTVTIAAGVGSAAVNVGNSGWSWASPTPQGRDLHAIAFAGGTGFAVGDGGAALATGDAGHTWSGLNTGTGGNLEQVQAISPTSLVVTGASGCVTRISSNGGQTFKRIFNVAESGCPEPVAAFSFVSAQSGYLLLANGSLEATNDGGESFAKRTAIPGTPVSSAGGSATGVALHFTTPTAGLAIVSTPGGTSNAFSTADGGVSWTPVPLPPGARVSALHYVDASNAYAVGPGTFLRSTDGGATWKQEPIALGNSFTSIDCDSATECVMTVTGANELLVSADGGATASVKALSSMPIFAAGYAGPAKLVAVGAGGTTVVSADGGNTFTAVSSAVNGTWSRLRAEPGGLLAAIGERGELALSADGGATWKVIETQTSAELIDAAFASPQVGYALDATGGLQRTSNGGGSWETLSTAGGQPRAVAAVGASVLLFGPRGVQRAVGGGRFRALGGLAGRAPVTEYALAGETVFAYGTGTSWLIRSTDGGAGWRRIRLPLTDRRGRTRETLRSVSFTSASQGYVLDTLGRLWITRNAGASWRELPATGTSNAETVDFSDPLHGYLSGFETYDEQHEVAYVLRTNDGGASWHPQQVSAGKVPDGGLVALAPAGAALLVRGQKITEGRLFFTTSGGEVAGTPGALALTTARTRLTRRQLRVARHEVVVSGTLTGAIGGEQIVVSRRASGGGAWQHQTVLAGANGGSFTTTWRVNGSSLFVAQWAGDSGRPGLGSRTLSVTVR